MTQEALTLKNGKFEIWFCPIAEAPAIQVSDDERRRALSMLPENKAREFISCRQWLRWLSRRYLENLCETELAIQIHKNGKPYARDFPAFEFNLSHSGNLVAIIFGRQPVGIDIEMIRPVPDWAQIANGFLSPNSIRRIQQASPAHQEQGFLSEFTAREAHGKATGLGLSRAPNLLETGQADKIQDLTLACPPLHRISGIAIETKSYGLPVPLACPPGYVGHVCVMAP